MARDTDEKYRILAEIFTLLSEQERSVPEIAEYGEVPEHSLRAERIEICSQKSRRKFRRLLRLRSSD